jgi:signal transduction histidine kinase
MMRTHPAVIVDDHVGHNPYYEPPEIRLNDATESLRNAGRRVEWWIERLTQGQALEEEQSQLARQSQLLARRLMEVQDAERRHLARELHDEIGQLLTTLRLLLRPGDPSVPESTANRLAQARSIIDELLEKVRSLSFDLLPAVLEHLGLLPALVALVQRYAEQTGLLVDFQHTDLMRRFSAGVETSAYRLIQEALTNVARHAGVAGVKVRVWIEGNHLHLLVEDRGLGFDSQLQLSEPKSVGLLGMMERVKLQGGTLRISARPGAGTLILASLPVEPPDAGSRP